MYKQKLQTERKSFAHCRETKWYFYVPYNEVIKHDLIIWLESSE